MSLRIVFAGTPAFAVPSLRVLHEAHQMVGVLTQPDRPTGRGRLPGASPMKQCALELGLPVAQPGRLRGDAGQLAETLAQLLAWQPDVLVVAAYGLILPREVLELPPLGCLNIHASLLPRWRGAAPIQRAILAGDTATGISIMQMDEGLDTGAVVANARIAIGAETTTAQLHDQLAALGAQQILLALAAAIAGTLDARPQAVEGVMYAQKLAKSESPIEWRHDAVMIDRQIRALNPWPTAETQYADERIKLLRSRVADAAAPANVLPGTLLGVKDDALEVACGQGVLQVMELQRAGRKPVAARDFYNALRLPAEKDAVFG